MAFCVALFVNESEAARILHLVDGGASESHIEGVNLAGQFYGADIDRIYLAEGRQLKAIKDILSNTKFEGIVLTTRIGAVSERLDMLELLDQTLNEQTHVYIENIQDNTSGSALMIWSEGRIRSCKELSGSYKIRVSSDGGLTHIVGHLKSMEYSYHLSQGCTFEAEGSSGVQMLISTASHPRGDALPLFIMYSRNQQKVFLMSAVHVENRGNDRWERMKGEIWENVPRLMFMAYCLGEEGWHAPGYYANLTIDDPWLREPYGDLSYYDLLGEMARANFHTSIAFIPWNYDRSERGVVEVVRDNPGRFSFAIHGNDHDHRDFALSMSGEWYDFNVRQAIWRMEEFFKLTRIPYDKVMIFPRGIVPRKSFESLKQHDFLATVNASNVPTDEVEPENVSFYMRSGTVQFGNLLSLRRNSIDGVAKSDIALQLFLGNPLLFYAHHDLFKSGVSSFSQMARWVNEIEPRTDWTSLGDVIKHYYSIRKKGERAYEVQMWSPEIQLENNWPHPIRLLIRKSDDRPIRNTGGTCTQSLGEWSSTNGVYEASLLMPAESSCELRVEYANAATNNPTSFQKATASSTIIRVLSDFRDIALSKVPRGRRLILGVSKWSPATTGESIAVAFVAICFGIAAVSWKMLRRRVLRKSPPSGSAQPPL